MDIVNEWHKSQVDLLAEDRKRYPVIPRVECNDGFHISIQAGHTHYCTPRENEGWPYSKFELGYPSEEEPALSDYAEEPDKPLNTVYAWVPVETLVELLEKHGGIKGVYVYPEAR